MPFTVFCKKGGQQVRAWGPSSLHAGPKEACDGMAALTGLQVWQDPHEGQQTRANQSGTHVAVHDFGNVVLVELLDSTVSEESVGVVCVARPVEVLQQQGDASGITVAGQVHGMGGSITAWAQGYL